MYTYSLNAMRLTVRRNSTIPSSQATGLSELSCFSSSHGPRGLHGPLRTLKSTLCKCNPRRREGAFWGLRPELKVCRANVAHSPGVFEMTKRLMAFELTGGSDHSNVVTQICRRVQEGSIGEYVYGLHVLLLVEYVYMHNDLYFEVKMRSKNMQKHIYA